MSQKIRVLMVEDTPLDAKLTLYALKRYGFEVDHERVQDAACMRQVLLQESWDIILCDYTMPQFSGEAALEILKESSLDIPFILVSGKVGEEAAVAMMKSGASDFVMKDNLGRLPTAVERELREATMRAQKQKAESELASQRILMETILTQAAEAILVCDQQGRVMFANPAALQLAGQPNLEALQVANAWGTEMGLDGSPVAVADWIIPRALRGEVMLGQEVHLLRQDGRVYDVLINGAPLQAADGSVIGAVSILTDITQLRKAEEQQRKYAEELERSNRDLKEFASIASHDLKEPLRKVKVFGDLLVKSHSNKMDEEAKDYLLRMVDASKRMDEMISGLLTYSRLSTGEHAFSQVDLAVIAHEVLSDLEVLMAQTHGSVEIDCLPVIEANQLQIRQLLQNLISNALKFHDRSRTPQVKVWAESIPSNQSQKQMICLHVQDNGIGFDEKHLERIFQPFQRLHARKDYEGSGMGLAICHKIVDRHHGSITASSQPGLGTTFMVTLPLTQPVFPEDESL